MSKPFLLPAHQLQTKCKLYQFCRAAPAARVPLRRHMQGRYRDLAPAPSTTGPVEPCPPLVEATKPPRGGEARKINRASSSTSPTALPGARSRARRCCRSRGCTLLARRCSRSRGIALLGRSLLGSRWSRSRGPALLCRSCCRRRGLALLGRRCCCRSCSAKRLSSCSCLKAFPWFANAHHPGDGRLHGACLCLRLNRFTVLLVCIVNCYM